MTQREVAIALVQIFAAALGLFWLACFFGTFALAIGELPVSDELIERGQTAEHWALYYLGNVACCWIVLRAFMGEESA